ncbi:MAG: ABC transporter permease, partial [Planctomycetota bacterium]
MSTPVVIDAQGLTRRFGSLVAVDGVQFHVHRGSIFGLLGPNGSGKSTIIRMLCGVLAPSAGDAQVLGRPIRTDAEMIKRRIGYMSQQFSLYGDLTVSENIEFYGRVYGLAPARLAQRRKEVLDLTALGDRIDQLAATLSGGWKQRLALACALVHEPELLYLDEPTAGIDPVARRQLWDLLFELSGRGVTLFVTTHYMDEAERCSEIGYIYRSRLLVVGRPDQLKALPDVTPQGTKRWEIETDQAAVRLSRLRGEPDVMDATLFGDKIHVLAREDVDEAGLIERLGATPGEAVARGIDPGLEDVFVTLTAAAEDAHERGEPITTYDEQAVAEAEDLPDVLEPPPAAEAPTRRSTDGLFAILFKEFFHLRRQPSSLVFMLVLPLIEVILFGYAIETQIENIPTVVYDQDGRAASRELIQQFENTKTFTLAEWVYDDDAFHRALTSGRARVGIRVPPDYSDRLVQGQQVEVQVLIDGSDSQVATTALNASNLLGNQVTIQIARERGEQTRYAPARDRYGAAAPPIEMRPRLLFNPNLESAYFFVPGLVGIILQLVTLFLTSFAVVREREQGTLEQLFVTPVGRAGLLLGKLTPYALVGIVETVIVLAAMVFVFGVPINGSLMLLLSLSVLFIVTSLGLGLLISTLARTQVGAMQAAFMVMLPSVLLSGFVCPRSEMPLLIYLVSFTIPVTYFIEILRGVVLRGADLIDVWPHVVGLAACCVVVL